MALAFAVNVATAVRSQLSRCRYVWAGGSDREGVVMNVVAIAAKGIRCCSHPLPVRPRGDHQFGLAVEAVHNIDDRYHRSPR
jgi:hypothetical protein